MGTCVVFDHKMCTCKTTLQNVMVSLLFTASLVSGVPLPQQTVPQLTEQVLLAPLHVGNTAIDTAQQVPGHTLRVTNDAFHGAVQTGTGPQLTEQVLLAPLHVGNTAIDTVQQVPVHFVRFGNT